MERPLEEQMRYDRAKKRVKAIKGFFMHLTAYILVNAFLLVLIWAGLKQGEAFFTFGHFSTAFFWGFGLLFHALGVFGANMFLGNNWEERKIKEMMQQEHDKSQKWE
ncbi:2TM domain-containing protein [Flavobacterium salilacus subsp. salilacus]|uniref:2TM domain-containing protein n=1 Tax=Flavobacterium TaxID=237 RepID=UPI0010758C54|nr:MULTISPECIES: 2TM domain-containing protein [Flavobacterium]KAF2516847.1 2TM domain-containing protein [Flavobacterium salilacus subsp. salilacus]MBE1615794.1 2TM domain-containing protein [Flavobacterium sp. SaA2.13]NDI99822.1 2TM domain-containing protein [Flavobacterium salilacus subsp. altitudinum]